MYCEPVDKSELLQIINDLRINKSAGPDEISPKLIKDTAMARPIAEPLTFIFNLSLNTGIFPSRLKIAKVIPVYKKGEVHLPSNYRPISLHSVFNKLLEKIMHKRLCNYLNSNNILAINYFVMSVF